MSSIKLLKIMKNDIFTKTYLNIINEGFLDKLFGKEEQAKPSQNYHYKSNCNEYYQHGEALLHQDWKKSLVYFKKAVEVSRQSGQNWNWYHCYNFWNGDSNLDSSTLAYIRVGLLEFYQNHNMNEAIKYFSELVNIIMKTNRWQEFHSDAINAMVDCFLDMDKKLPKRKHIPQILLQFIQGWYSPQLVYDRKEKQVVEYWDYRESHPEEFDDQDEEYD